MRSTFRVWIPLLLCAVGSVFMIDRLAPTAHILSYVRVWWPLVLVATGIGGGLRLALARMATLRGPIVLVLLGGVLLTFTRGFLPRSSWQFVWPGLLIVGGVGLLAVFAIQDQTQMTSGIVRLVTVAESRTIVVRQTGLIQGNITAVVSGCVLDLREARFHRPEDDEGRQGRPEARIDITSVFSGVELLVPFGWQVEYDYFPRRSSPSPLLVGDQNAPSLQISALRILGAVKVRQTA